MMGEGVKEYNIIFTHAHWDHILGFPFFRPIYSKDTTIKMLGSVTAQESIKRILSKMMLPPNFPIKLEDIHAEISYIGTCPDWFRIQGVSITPIPLSHPNKGMGFKFEEDSKSFVFLTDNELAHKHPGGLDYEDYLEFSRGADLLIHDAEYSPEDYHATRTWGHSVYIDALDLAIKAGVKRFGLFHHNQERKDNEIDRMVEDCKNIIEKHGAELDCFAVAQDMVIEI